MTDDRSPALIIADAIANISEGHAQLAVDALKEAGWEIVRNPSQEDWVRIFLAVMRTGDFNCYISEKRDEGAAIIDGRFDLEIIRNSLLKRLSEPNSQG